MMPVCDLMTRNPKRWDTEKLENIVVNKICCAKRTLERNLLFVVFDSSLLYQNKWKPEEHENQHISPSLFYFNLLQFTFFCITSQTPSLRVMFFICKEVSSVFNAKFHDVTRFKCENEPNIDFKNWKDDKGFWSNNIFNIYENTKILK